MQIDVGIENQEELARAVALYTTSYNGDQRQFVQQAAGLYAADFMDSVPPFTGGNTQGKTNGSQKKTGEKRTIIDLRKAITPAEYILKGETRNKNLRKLLQEENIPELNKYFQSKNAKGWKGWRAEKSFDPREHTGHRFKPFLKSRKVMTFNDPKWNRYSRAKKKTVGWLKAGWGVAAAALGQKVPAWVSRHFPYAKGSVRIENPTQGSINVVIENHTPTVRHFVTGFNIKMRARNGKLAKQALYRIKYNLKKYGKFFKPG